MASALALASSGVGADPIGLQVTPLWQARADAVAPLASSLRTFRAGLSPEGTLFVVAQDARSYFVSLRVDAAGGRSDGQWGLVLRDMFPRLDSVLAAGTSGSVVRIWDPVGPLGVSRGATVLLDDEGNRRWARPFHGVWASLLPDGDVVLGTDANLLRLAAVDGSVVWSVSLAAVLGVHEEPGPAAFALAADAVTVSIRGNLLGAGVGGGRERIARFALADGALRWTRERPAELAGTRLCGIGSRGDDVVLAWIGGEVRSAMLHVARHDANDGALLSVAQVGAVPDLATRCQIVDLADTSVVGTRDDAGATTLVGIDAQGALRWRRDAAPGSGSTLARVGTSDDLVRVARPDGQLRVERFRAVDGDTVWSTSQALVDAPVADLRVAAADHRVLVAVPNANDVRRVELDAVDGAVLSTAALRPSPVFAPAGTAAFIDGVPYLAQIVFRGAHPELAVRRLQADTGALAWERFHALPAGVAVPNARVTLTRAGPFAVVVGLTAASIVDPEVGSSALLGLASGDGSTLWRQDLLDRQIADAVTAPEVLGAGDAGVVLRRRACSSASTCAAAVSSYEFRSLASGATAWSRDGAAWFAALSAQAALVFTRDPGSTTPLLAFHALSDGQRQWSQEITPSWIGAGTLAEAGGGLLATYSVPVGSGSLSAIQLERRELADGAVTWALQRGPTPTSASMPTLTAIGPSDVLQTATRIDDPAGQSIRSPYLERVDGVTGASRWSITPPAPGSGNWSVVPFGTPQGSVQALRSLRESFRSLGQFNVERWFVGAVDLETAGLTGEHLLYRRLRGVLTPAARLRLSQRDPDGTIGIVDLTPDARGNETPTIARIPAAAGPDVDIVMRVVDGDGVQTGLGPHALVDVDIENASAVAIPGISLGGETLVTSDGVEDLAMRWVSCQLQGPGSCPTNLGVGVDATLALGPGSVARMRLEALDPRYRHARFPSDFAKSIVLYADAPYDYGDVAPGNNVVPLTVRVGGFADGFD